MDGRIAPHLCGVNHSSFPVTTGCYCCGTPGRPSEPARLVAAWTIDGTPKPGDTLTFRRRPVSLPWIEKLPPGDTRPTFGVDPAWQQKVVDLVIEEMAKAAPITPWNGETYGAIEDVPRPEWKDHARERNRLSDECGRLATVIADLRRENTELLAENARLRRGSK